ncbi:hypothetical protein NQ314_004783 [Rhamnusium bicolor]|uniref:Uncharacterized protein n=1 Tax=Rhamnusium bicolor TaxID=1586634 RepID=A0AAV8ZL40_9CUCU|nr:hypothetical protein NQ314_004783 [Rhamnusium bicolor]
MEYVHVDVTVFPTPPPPPPPPPPPGISAKLLAIMRKYKFNWRLSELAHPKILTPKFVYKIEKPLRYGPRKELVLTDHTTFYSDQISRPLVRTLVINKRLFGKLKGRPFIRKVNRRMKKSWDSIYNFYRKKERDKRLRQLRREAMQLKIKKSKTFLRTLDLAKPKRVFKPAPPKRKKPKKIFSDYVRLYTLASPKPYVEEPPKREGLSSLPERWLNLPKPLVPGQVKRAALKYKLTPKTEALSVPRPRSEKAREDEGYDPWTISKTALKYKATPRILELAKPIERD